MPNAVEFPASQKQVDYLVSLAYCNCEIDNPELSELAEKFKLMTLKQASDLIAAWAKLPKIRSQPYKMSSPMTMTPPASRPPVQATAQSFTASCPHCGVRATSPTTAGAMEAIKKHIEDHHNHQCSVCSRAFASAAEFKQHTADAHPSYPIPEKGYYSVQVPINGVMEQRFYRVTQGRKPGALKRFVRIAGDRPVYIETEERRFAAAIICALPSLAMETYGKLIGKCGCCGRQLTDPDSRAQGIGPECIKNYKSRSKMTTP